MRSVFALLKSATNAEVTAFLQRTYSFQMGPPWINAVQGDPCLYINFVQYKHVVSEPDEQTEIIRQLGHEPSVVIMADVSGRHPGDEQVSRFVTAILTQFPGVAQDEYTPHCWTLDEVLQGDLVDGHPFFDYRGWYGADSNHA